MEHEIMSWDSALSKLAHAVNEYGCPVSWLSMPRRIRDRATLAVVRGSDPKVVMEMYCAA